MNRQLQNILSRARSHPYIIVSGPQRSGTTIASKIIGKELGYKYVDEWDFNIDNMDLFRHHIHNDINVIIQCPAIMHELHDVYKQFYDKVFFVIMKRNIDDIISSQKRINWGKKLENEEKKKYIGKSVFDMFFGKAMPVSKIKYRVWDMFQSKIIDDRQWTYCEYEWLSSHEMFLPKEERKGFKPKQTEKGRIKRKFR